MVDGGGFINNLGNVHHFVEFMYTFTLKHVHILQWMIYSWNFFYYTFIIWDYTVLLATWPYTYIHRLAESFKLSWSPALTSAHNQADPSPTSYALSHSLSVSIYSSQASFSLLHYLSSWYGQNNLLASQYFHYFSLQFHSFWCFILFVCQWKVLRSPRNVLWETKILQTWMSSIYTSSY